MKKRVRKKRQGNKESSGQIREEFSGKNLTCFGGTGLIRRFFKRHKIEKTLDGQLQVEGRRQCRYPSGRMCIGLLYAMFLGFSRPTQMQILRGDSVFQKVAGLLGFPVQSTISRFLSSLKIAVAHQLGTINLGLVKKVRGGFKTFVALTLDLDSHVTTVYGRQQRAGRGYNPKKKGRCSYHSLLCFIGETRDYVGGKLRSGKHHSSHQAVGFLRGVLKELPDHLQKIRLRADSGFFSLDMLQFLTQEKIDFYLVVPLLPWVQSTILQIRTWRSIDRRIEVAECPLVMGKKYCYRMVVIRKKVRQNDRPKKQLSLLHLEDVLYDYQAIVTSSRQLPEGVWRFYNQRACCENFIKEGIYGFGLDKVVSHHYAGNAAYFELLMLAYNLMNLFKEEVLNQRKHKQTVQTIRLQLFLIPGKLRYGQGRCTITLQEDWAYRQDYEEALARVA